MRITKISVWQLDLPLNEPHFLSGGRLKFETLDSTFVRIDTDEGISGWVKDALGGIPICLRMVREFGLELKQLRRS